MKHLLILSNYLGGEYYLAPDEVFQENDLIVIQENKNNSKSSGLPKTADIKDGLFKLILYSNLNELLVNDKPHAFEVRLKMTGQFVGQLSIPSSDTQQLQSFLQQNRFTPSQTKLIHALQREATINPRLNIVLEGRA